MGEDLLIIQKEFSGFSDTNERLDLLALDRVGNLVIIENKLDDSGKDMTWQLIKYASYCSSLTKQEIIKIYQYIKSFSLSYLDYNKWIKKCKEELESNYKKAFYYKKDLDIGGVIIFQPHKKEKSILEMKNFRVSPVNKNKGIGLLLYKSVEQYAKKQNFKIIQGDTHNNEMINFLLEKGFKIIKKERLYSPSQIEIILQKNLKDKN